MNTVVILLDMTTGTESMMLYILIWRQTHNITFKGAVIFLHFTFPIIVINFCVNFCVGALEHVHVFVHIYLFMISCNGQYKKNKS